MAVHGSPQRLRFPAGCDPKLIDAYSEELQELCNQLTNILKIWGLSPATACSSDARKSQQEDSRDQKKALWWVKENQRVAGSPISLISEQISSVFSTANGTERESSVDLLLHEFTTAHRIAAQLWDASTASQTSNQYLQEELAQVRQEVIRLEAKHQEEIAQFRLSNEQELMHCRQEAWKPVQDVAGLRMELEEERMKVVELHKFLEQSRASCLELEKALEQKEIEKSVTQSKYDRCHMVLTQTRNQTKEVESRHNLTQSECSVASEELLLCRNELEESQRRNSKEYEDLRRGLYNEVDGLREEVAYHCKAHSTADSNFKRCYEELQQERARSMQIIQKQQAQQAQEQSLTARDLGMYRYELAQLQQQRDLDASTIAETRRVMQVQLQEQRELDAENRAAMALDLKQSYASVEQLRERVCQLELERSNAVSNFTRYRTECEELRRRMLLDRSSDTVELSECQKELKQLRNQFREESESPRKPEILGELRHCQMELRQAYIQDRQVRTELHEVVANQSQKHIDDSPHKSQVLLELKNCQADGRKASAELKDCQEEIACMMEEKRQRKERSPDFLLTVQDSPRKQATEFLEAQAEVGALRRQAVHDASKIEINEKRLSNCYTELEQYRKREMIDESAMQASELSQQLLRMEVSQLRSEVAESQNGHGEISRGCLMEDSSTQLLDRSVRSTDDSIRTIDKNGRSIEDSVRTVVEDSVRTIEIEIEKYMELQPAKVQPNLPLKTNDSLSGNSLAPVFSNSSRSDNIRSEQCIPVEDIVMVPTPPAAICSSDMVAKVDRTEPPVPRVVSQAKLSVPISAARATPLQIPPLNKRSTGSKSSDEISYSPRAVQVPLTSRVSRNPDDSVQYPPFMTPRPLCTSKTQPALSLAQTTVARDLRPKVQRLEAALVDPGRGRNRITALKQQPETAKAEDRGGKIVRMTSLLKTQTETGQVTYVEPMRPFKQ